MVLWRPQVLREGDDGPGFLWHSFVVFTTSFNQIWIEDNPPDSVPLAIGMSMKERQYLRADN